MGNLVLIIEYVMVGLGFFNIGIAGTVALRFLLITYHEKRPGPKPWHIWLIGLSYSILAAMAATSRLHHLGDSFWRWAGYSIATLTGTVALLIMARYQWRMPPMEEKK